MQKITILLVAVILIFGACSFFQPAEQPSTANVNSGVITNEANNPPADSSASFDFTGTVEMDTCNTRAICHTGTVVFDNGDVLTITDNAGKVLEIDDSDCNSESCYVQDIDGKDWDLVWIKE